MQSIVIQLHIQKALLAAGVPHTHDLYCAVWGFSRDQTADEREAAAYLGGRDRDDVRSHELMDRRLINGQFRRGAMGGAPPQKCGPPSVSTPSVTRDSAAAALLAPTSV